MKKTLLAAVICAAFVSTGAFAQPAHTPTHHNNNVHTVTHQTQKPAPKTKVVKHQEPKPAPHIAKDHHPKPAPHVKHHHPKPAPKIVKHHHHNHTDLGDVLIAFAILATAMN